MTAAFCFLSLVADVAPTRWPLVHQLTHREVAPDVRMAWEKVTVDLYPTVAHVHAHFGLAGGERGARELSVGFPSELRGIEGQEIEEIDITVGGKPVIYGREPQWWTWTIDVPAGQEVVVDVRYLQPLLLDTGDVE